MAETERPKLANLISIVFILAALGVLILGYLFFFKPATNVPSLAMENSLTQYSVILLVTIQFMPQMTLPLIMGAFTSTLLSLQMNAATYLSLFTASIIMVVILIASAFGFAYRKKWGYYLTFLSSLFLIITPILGYILGFPIIYIVGSAFFAILGVLFILYLRGEVKEEF
ncbi:MAG: hypothetical protein QW279_07435 [Candidatus Jordarchaeaceae archaeon]